MQFRLETSAAAGPVRLTTLTVRGHRQSFPVNYGPRGTTVRFAAGQPGARSSVWRLWSNPAKSDLYLSVRTANNRFKYSFHQSGRWHLHRPDSEHDSMDNVVPTPNAAESGYLDRWARPEPVLSGWTRALSVFIPSNDFPVGPDDTKWEDVLWVEPPLGRKARIFDVWLVTPEYDGWCSMSLPGGRDIEGVVDCFGLPNGEVAVVTYGSRLLTSRERQVVRQARKAMRKSVPTGFSLAIELRPRSLAYLQDESGNRIALDLAFRAPE